MPKPKKQPPKGFKGWSPAAPVRPRDNIVSSQAKEKGETGFIPTYEKEPHIWMRFLMSNEYMRMWFKERAVYEKEVYSKKESSDEIKRKYVQRMMTHKKKTKELPPIKLKRFANISAKVKPGSADGPKQGEAKNESKDESGKEAKDESNKEQIVE